MVRIKLLFLSLFAVPFLYSQQNGYMFRLELKDKGCVSFDVEHPEDFLSERAIERRKRQNIQIDETDIPISQSYIEEIKSFGCEVVAKSKWLQSVSVYSADSTVVDSLKRLDYVDKVTFVWKGGQIKKKSTGSQRKIKTLDAVNSFYGQAETQIALHEGEYLHNNGYRGNGLQIAVIDAGYAGFRENLLLSHISVKGTKDFVFGGDDMFGINSSSHGISVLSCMATNVPDKYVGTAPEATYWLLRSEDPRSEFPIEEDYWVAAAEYADSVGVDLINTSLGYSGFDFPAQSYIYEQMNGKTAFITRGAEIASSKGILMVCSAGNEGNKAWGKITAPSDAKNVLTVGAVNGNSVIAAFSSRGPAFDGRIKPDVMAVGSGTAIVNKYGEVTSSNGTSFSSPVMCGLVACFWQAFPDLTNKEVIDIIKKSSDRYVSPDSNYGYGIPNMQKAVDIAKAYTGIDALICRDDKFSIKTDSTNGTFTVTKADNDNAPCITRVFSADGRIYIYDSFSEHERKYSLGNKSGNMYLGVVSCEGNVQTFKILY
ncbi:MAG: S8 family peptidase [Dysgonomonas sp.]